MSQPNGDGPRLPDFRGGEVPPSAAAGPSAGAATRPRRPLSGPTIAMMAVGAMALLLVLTLIVLTLTVFRPSNEPPAAAPPTVTEPEQREPAGGEYVPDGEEAPEPTSEEVTHIQAPTALCEFPTQEPAVPQTGSVRTSGDLSFTVPEGWGGSGVDWSVSLPYAMEVASADRQVSQGYFALAQVGQVEWSEEQGGYPGAERAAMAYVQCHLTRPEGVEMYGEEPLMTQYVSESTQVDGHEAWIVRGVVEVQNPGTITEYNSVEMVAIVVETPSGPAVLKVTGPADIPERAADVQAIVDSLTVG